MKRNAHTGKSTKAPAFVLRAERALRRAAKNVQTQNRALTFSTKGHELNQCMLFNADTHVDRTWAPPMMKMRPGTGQTQKSAPEENGAQQEKKRFQRILPKKTDPEQAGGAEGSHPAGAL